MKKFWLIGGLAAVAIGLALFINTNNSKNTPETTSSTQDGGQSSPANTPQAFPTEKNTVKFKDSSLNLPEESKKKEEKKKIEVVRQHSESSDAKKRLADISKQFEESLKFPEGSSPMSSSIGLGF